MQQIIERQKVANEYRSMMMEGMSLIPKNQTYTKMIWWRIFNILRPLKWSSLSSEEGGTE